MPFFTKKPVTIEAIQFDGSAQSAIDIKEWSAQYNARETIKIVLARPLNPSEEKTFALTISTLEGDMHAFAGDYIIKGVKNEFYPCKPDIFIETYDPSSQ